MEDIKYNSKPLVFGILATIFSLVPPLSFLAFVLGMIGTVIGYRKKETIGNTGWILSLTGMAISSIIMILFVLFISSRVFILGFN